MDESYYNLKMIKISNDESYLVDAHEIQSLPLSNGQEGACFGALEGIEIFR